MKIWIIVVIVLCVVCLKIVTGHFRHTGFDSHLQKAWHITLPGYTYSYSPEHTVDLQQWVGTRYSTLVAHNKDGSPNPEATAGLALKAMGVYDDQFSLVKRGDHWALWKPHITHRRFSWTAYYRVGPWIDAE